MSGGIFVISLQSLNVNYWVLAGIYAPSVLCKLFYVGFVVDSIPSALTVFSGQLTHGASDVFTRLQRILAHVIHWRRL
jgi:hypothetical protein